MTPIDRMGFLNIEKPLGVTAHDCVAQVRRILRTKRVGHSGTLDPMATGVLPIAVNQATRLLPYLTGGKAYKALIRLGQATTTDDREGEILHDHPSPDLTLDRVSSFLSQFKGQIQQYPPAYSAIHVGGKRLYELARAGTVVDIPLRTVEVTGIEVLDWQPGIYPEISLAISCGTGTYIRSIARDLGALLGCGGMLAGLERTESNGFHRSGSIPLEKVTSDDLLPPDRVLGHLSKINLDPDRARRWQLGQRIGGMEFSDRVVQVYGEAVFLGIGKIALETLHPVVVIKDASIS